MQLRFIFSIVFFSIMFCGMAMALPAFCALWYQEWTECLLFSFISLETIILGFSGFSLLHQEGQPLRPKGMFLSTTLIWVFFSVFAALPFYFSSLNLSFTNSLMEAVSGLTTTGATVLNNLDSMSHAILFWRSLLQWLGGIGVVIVAITVLPNLHIGGMQFFFTESAQRTQRQSPKVVNHMQIIIISYILLSALCAVSLYFAGMNWFDSINHALTCISTGGFSTKDANIGFYDNPTIEYILTFFMGVGSLPLILSFLILKRQWAQIRGNAQIMTFFLLIVFSFAALLFFRWNQFSYEIDTFFDLMRTSLFQIVSVVSSTGYVLENYALWGNFAVVLFLFLMMTGGCTGSTSGGIKMFRYSIMSKNLVARLKSLIYPRAIFVPKYGTRPVSDELLNSVYSYLTLFFITTAISSLVFAFIGLDALTALSLSLASISSLGSALGDMGPDKSWAMLPTAAKWVSMCVMLLGRLEFISIVILFLPLAWNKNS